MTAFLLIHSPLVGPLTWAPVADELRRRGFEAIVPVLAEGGDGPAWKVAAESVGEAVRRADGAGVPLMLVGHSGAGPLLPCVRQAMGRPVAGYLFVDAGIPEGGASRLDLLRAELPEAAEQLTAHLAAGGRYPAWRDEDLREVLPDPAMRAMVLAEMRPQALAFWKEPLPVMDRWPDVPCGYVQLTDGYEVPAARARREGWPYRRLVGGHFQMLVDPVAMTDALLDVTAEMGVTMNRERS